MSEVILAFISTNEDVLLIRAFCKNCTSDILKKKKNIIVYRTWSVGLEEVDKFKKMGVRCLNLSHLCQCKKNNNSCGASIIVQNFCTNNADTPD